MPSLGEAYAALRERRKSGRPVDFEALLRHFYQQLLKPGDIAVDVGVFKGTHTLPMAEAIRGIGAQLHAFEANPAMAEAMRPILTKGDFGFVTLHECAVAAEDGQANFVIAVEAPGYSGLQQREYDQPDVTTRNVTVRTVRLDSRLAYIPACAFVKIDIEGGEYDALRGATALVDRHRPAISFEFGRRSYGAYGVDPGEVFDWFASRRYMIFDIIGNPLLTRERFLRADSIPGLWDFLAVPEEKPPMRQLARAQQMLMD